jgi:hypothetical protein
MDSDFMKANPPKKAGIAARMPVQCADTIFPQDWQLTARPGPSADLRQRLMAARLQ